MAVPGCDPASIRDTPGFSHFESYGFLGPRSLIAKIGGCFAARLGLAASFVSLFWMAQLMARPTQGN